MRQKDLTTFNNYQDSWKKSYKIGKKSNKIGKKFNKIGKKL